MRPSIERANEKLDPQPAASEHTTAPINHTRPSPRKHSPDGATKAGIQLQLATHLSTQEGWKAELASRLGWALNTPICLWLFLNVLYVAVQSLIKFYVIIFYTLLSVPTPKTPRNRTVPVYLGGLWTPLTGCRWEKAFCDWWSGRLRQFIS